MDTYTTSTSTSSSSTSTSSSTSAPRGAELELELQRCVLELQQLRAFQQQLPLASSPVARAVQTAVLTVQEYIREAEQKLAAATLASSHSLTAAPIASTDSLSGDGDGDIPSVLLPLARSSGSELNLPLQSATEVIALFHHSILLSFDGVVCIAEKSGGGVPGFAAPLSPLPPDSFVPPQWNKSRNSITFMYKHKAAAGKTIKLEVTKSSDDATLVKIGFKSATSKPVEVRIMNSTVLKTTDFNTCTQPTALVKLYSDISPTTSSATDTILEALPFLQEEVEKAKQRELAAKQSVPMEVTRELPPPRLQHAHINRSFASSIPSHPPSRTAGYSVGHSDLHPPLPNVVDPRFPGMGPRGELPSLYGDDDYNGRGVGIPSGNGGMLVGPDHAIFQGGVQGGVGMFPPGGAPGFGSGMPQPRFDPVTNPDIYNDPMVAPGGQGRGGPGRGRGRGGRGAPRVPGEPAPDHLRPPNFGDFI